MVNFRNAVPAFRALNGLICVYKPIHLRVEQVQHTIVTNLCRDLNALPGRPQEQYVKIEGPTDQPLSVSVVPNYADDPLVCGPRYINEDFKCSWATYLGKFTSGLLLLGLNEGSKLTRIINTSRLTRAFKVHGQLGKATHNFFWHGRTVERSTFNHVTREKIDGIVAHMQAAHQRTMFEIAGVDMESQAMYEMASQGPIRPANSKLPVLYGIKCVYFKPPDFTLEVQSINEYEQYLWTLVNDLGIQLKSTAHCTGVQCIRQGPFNLDLALLRKHWKLEHIVDNMDHCRRVLEENEHMIVPETAVLRN